MSPRSRIRGWHLESGFLVDRGPASTPVVGSLSQALPEGPFRELHDYVKLDAEGKVCGEFRVSSWSIDDELSVQAYAVIAGELRERTVRTFYGDARPDSQEEKSALTGLRDVDDGKTLDFLEKALAAEQRRTEDHAGRLRREGEARVAAIPGATTDPGLGAAYLRAQELLRERVTVDADSLYVELLRTLGRIASLAGSNPAAIDAFVEACRHAAFDSFVDREKAKLKEPGTPAPAPTDLHPLKETLGTLQRTLMERAEGQEQADATQNAAAFRKAADRVGRAAERLRGGFEKS